MERVPASSNPISGSNSPSIALHMLSKLFVGLEEEIDLGNQGGQELNNGLTMKQIQLHLKQCWTSAVLLKGRSINLD